MKKFVATARKGFRMTFENGYMVSVSWGGSNYCDNKNSECGSTNIFSPAHSDAESDTAEIYIMKNGKFINIYKVIKPVNLSEEPYEPAFFLSYVKPEEVAHILSTVADL